MLDAIISSKTKRKLLTLLLTNPKSKFYVREISRHIQENINSVREELKKLSSIGLVSSEKEANLLYYKINTHCPLYKDLKNLIYKTEALGSYLKEVSSFPNDIQLAFVYGSTAYNQEWERSDIDLLVIGDIDGEKLHRHLIGLEEKIGREINTVHMSLAEFKTKIKKKDTFLKRVLSGEKIFIKGNADVLSRIIKRR
ncbi:MAG: nucleotidyltransferase domain-containing protein [Candidatus Omnitrophica bacterium]|nr:nucleotidyltransferase domain-containing protein [Candidatus Omnitrophota bacterium]MBU4590847.1 nucleotidyltransferase domain-containing protein [Candidatus Omnitrophota bacterium]